MKAQLITPFVIYVAIFQIAGVFLNVANCQTVAQPISVFPLPQYIWEKAGPIVAYDWGLSAYIYLYNGSFYYMITGGSEFYTIWISVDAFDSVGFQINGMSADYVLSTVGPKDRTSSSAGLYKWVASEEKWEPIVIANITENTPYGVIQRSGDNSVAFSANQGKVSLLKIGSPERIWLILEVNEAGPIRVPQNGFTYLDVTNRFAAVFIVYKEIGPIPHPGLAFPQEPLSWVINRFEIANAKILFKNFGTSSVHVGVNIIVPPEVKVLNGTLNWSTLVNPEHDETHIVQINRTNLGTSLLNASFTYNIGETETIGPITLRQKLTMVPQIELDIKVPQETLLWMQYYQMNLTVANLDPYSAVIDLKPSFTDTIENEVIALTLNPFANIILHPKVKIKGSNIVYAAFFEGIRVAWAAKGVNFSYPKIWVEEIFIDNKRYDEGYVDIEIGKVHTVQVTLQNEESVSYSVAVILKESSYSQRIPFENARILPEHSIQAVELLPNSSQTIIFRICALDRPNIQKYTNLYLSLEIDQTYLRGTEILIKLTSPQHPLLTSETILVCILMFLVGIFVKSIYDVISHKIKTTKK